MVSLEVLRQVLIDNRSLVAPKTVFARAIAIGEFPRCILVGARGSGKSHLLFSRIQGLLASGRSWDDIVYIDFEDERLIGFGVADFSNLLEVQAEISGIDSLPALFLDEIQLIDGWEKFARRMADANAEIYITGSDVRMRDLKIEETLGGRFLTENVFPLSFSEFLRVKGVENSRSELGSVKGKIRIRRAFAEFFEYGGLPKGVNAVNRLEAVNDAFREIYLADVIVRHTVYNASALRMLLKQVAESIGQPLSFTRLTKMVKDAGTPIAKNTCISYLQYACESCLVLPISNIVGKLQDDKVAGSITLWTMASFVCSRLIPRPTNWRIWLRCICSDDMALTTESFSIDATLRLIFICPTRKQPFRSALSSQRIRRPWHEKLMLWRSFRKNCL